MPHRAVGAAEAAEPAQRVGVRQRHDRRVEHRREHESHRDGSGALREPDRAIADNRRRRPRSRSPCAGRRAGRRARVASGIANTRTIIGIASTIPIISASRPLAASQTGRNGSCTPSATNSAA